jgi:hypothetical protein
VAEAQGPSQSTDFSALNVGLEITNGIVSTRQIRLTGPYFDVLGTASIDLPSQTLRMTLTPSVSTADGEPLRTLPVPVLISGSFNAPKIGVDAEPLLRGVVTDRLSGVLREQGIDVPVGGTVTDALKVKAREEVGGLLRDQINRGKRPAPAAGTEDAAAAADPDAEAAPTDDEEKEAEQSPTDAAVDAGLKAIFGGKSP